VSVAREFVEVESGRNDSRAVLREAIALAKWTRAKLLIAKLDRLARSVSFISPLMDSDVEFAACDCRKRIGSCCMSWQRSARRRHAPSRIAR